MSRLSRESIIYVYRDVKNAKERAGVNGIPLHPTSVFSKHSSLLSRPFEKVTIKGVYISEAASWPRRWLSEPQHSERGEEPWELDSSP